MKNTKAREMYLLLASAILLIFAFSACGAQTPEKQILGEWNSADREIVWIFYEDGNMVGGDGDDYDGGQWSIDETTLSISAVYETVVFNYELDGRTLKLYENGELTGMLYKVTDEPIDFTYSADMESELVARLEESETFAQALSRFDNLTSYVHTGSEGNINENGDVGIYYTIKCVTPYKYVTEEDTHDVSFAYSPFADDFYYDGLHYYAGSGFHEETEYIWDEAGVAGEIDVDFFAELYPDENVVACELIQIETEEKRAEMTYRVSIDESHSYALEHKVCEVSVSYNADPEITHDPDYYPDSGRDWIENTFDWTNMCGTWSYADESYTLSVTIHSIDDANESIDMSWEFDGISGRDVYEFSRDWDGSFGVTVEHEDKGIAFGIRVDPDDGVSYGYNDMSKIG
ncbi:MAG: hypothetical protein ACOX7G_05925 [Candidatus Scatomorpha sp.]|jgi:hypothetical protein